MMKNTSKLLLHLLVSSILVGCSTNKSAILQNLNIDIKASTRQQLVSANTANEYLQLAKIYVDKKNHEMAIAAYQNALLIEPNNTKGLTGLATAYASQNLLTVAIPLFEKVVVLEATAKHYSNLGYAYYLNQQYDEAKRVLNQSVVMDPSYQQAKHNLALVDTNYAAEKQVQALSKEGKEVDFVTVNNVQNDEQNGIDALSNETGNIQQSSSGIYELNFPKQVEEEPIVSKIAVDIPSNEIVKSDIENSQKIIAAISGGITFKHAPVVSKLFDLASNGLVSLQLSSNNKYMEVINGNGLKGIAKSVSLKLKEKGVDNIRVADAKRFNLDKTHIQYRTGYRDDAVNLNHNLLNHPYLLRNDNLPLDVKIRLVLGRDLITNINHAELNLMDEDELKS